MVTLVAPVLANLLADLFGVVLKSGLELFSRLGLMSKDAQVLITCPVRHLVVAKLEAGLTFVVLLNELVSNNEVLEAHLVLFKGIVVFTMFSDKAEKG